MKTSLTLWVFDAGMFDNHHNRASGSALGVMSYKFNGQRVPESAINHRVTECGNKGNDRMTKGKAEVKWNNDDIFCIN
jgi:hypothetical protein